VRFTLKLFFVGLIVGCSPVMELRVQSSVTAAPLLAKTCSRAPKKSEYPYGHYPYKVASAKVLQPVGNGVKLHVDAAKAFKVMVGKARSQGIRLTPLSGFRSTAEQHYLFHEVARQRGQTPAQRAKVSAPPGYSEHHTGYAVDINSLEQSFAHTREYKWLVTHAEKYGFEESFPEHNPQGVAFEPWHWRYIKSPTAREVFKISHCSK